MASRPLGALRSPILPRLLLPRAPVRRRHAIRRGALGQPFGEWDGNPVSKRRRGDGFQVQYFLDGGEGPAWTRQAQYPVGAVGAGQVVNLQALGRHLTPEDFRRTVPRNLRPYVRVIPLRSPLTLERHDNYMVVFDTPQSAQAWRKQVHWLADFSRRYTMTSTMVGSVVPQEGYTVNGVHVAAVVRRFTLVPAEADLTSFCFDTLTKFKLKVAQSGGYPWLLERDASLVPRVLLKVRGAHMQPKDIMQALLYDSIRRNMAWDIDWRKKGRLSAVISLDDPKFTHIANDKELDERLRGDDQRWLITFASERGAQHFARTWHARDFPFPPAEQARWDLSEGARKASNDGSDVKTYAEALW